MNLNIVYSLIKKEFKQILRDNSSILTAFLMPLILLFLFGFGINFDTNTVNIGIVDQDNSDITRDVIDGLKNTKYLNCYFYKTTNLANKSLTKGKIRGYVVFPINFTKEYKKLNGVVKIQIITDGSEPNTAKFASTYIQGVIASFLEYKQNEKRLDKNTNKINAINRFRYNSSLKSINFILPGSLSIIMTMTGTILSALVIAREWERGTMEAILTAEVTKGEFILSKYISYFILGFLSIIFCLFIIIFIAHVPFLGSYFWLFVESMAFMLTGIGTGLLISTIFKNQFLASQMAGTIGFMPSMMLSGLIYELDSAPLFIRLISYFVPAKYYVSSITSLFLSGVILKTLIINLLYMLSFAFLIGFITLKLTKERLSEC